MFSVKRRSVGPSRSDGPRDEEERYPLTKERFVFIHMIIICTVPGMGDPQRAIDPKTRIEKCEPVQTNVHWPAPVDQRLNELLERLSTVGEEATRSQLLAALVASAPVAGSQLAALLGQYRRSTAGKIVLQRQGPIVLERRQPGRRPR
jgi:hypothetical protein